MELHPCSLGYPLLLTQPISPIFLYFFFDLYLSLSCDMICTFIRGSEPPQSVETVRTPCYKLLIKREYWRSVKCIARLIKLTPQFKRRLDIFFICPVGPTQVRTEDLLCTWELTQVKQMR